ncbi:uncharacterized protein MELLADRAFT_86273 [Melampsora larici-populina 98AG31]|uniref:GCM domain-containing protein n=1 Tax=Melampsora larici-populina (strain 98AG31 / pathotype 3-4-7) TaxID=747676 RepID=F4RL59_MELLP|nr:uncharacterized protein MELLADRAFT_86273 [Melampsora larici-populina 98AG31]EGG06848.1 hypothetical protein MELLADRAFT_86273 [Melampsora larici-populina 98AG31]
MDGPWKTIWYACLGVLRCDNNFCAYTAPPPTAKGKAAEYIKDGTHIWTQSPVTVCQIDIQKDTGWGVLCHSGFHAHPWPALKKADPLAMLDLPQEVVKNPNAGPLVLKVGQAGAGQTITPPVVDIHPAFANGGRLAYLRQKVLVKKGLIPEKESKGGGDRLIMDLMHWGKTSMYSKILHLWIPIQLTWMWGLEEAHYKAHFSTLLAQINAADLTYHKRDLLVQQFGQIARLFPKAKPWIDWWNTADIHSMLFCARDCLPMDNPPLPEGEDPHDYPDTTNGQESMHCQYYILTDFNSVLQGISVKYGNSWESVVETMGWSKERTRRRPKVNNGCPPDTTEALIRPKKVGRPTGSRNVNWDSHSSYQSYLASTGPGIEGKVGKLITLWSTEGLFSNNLRCCTTCCTDQDLTSTDADVSHDVTVGKLNKGDDIPCLYKQCRLDFTGQPMNVYFQRGFWGYHHYWSKVVRYVDGVRGVWFYDDRKDNGRAQLPTSSEQKIINLGIAKITSKNPDAQGDLPFVLQPDLDNVKEIEEDLTDLPVLDPPLATVASGMGTSQPLYNGAKVAFTSAASPAVDELEALETTDPTVGLQAVSQSDKAKQAFIWAQKSVVFSSANCYEKGGGRGG